METQQNSALDNGLGMAEQLAAALQGDTEQAKDTETKAETPSTEAPAKAEEKPAIPPSEPEKKPDEKQDEKQDEKPVDEVAKVEKRLKDTRDALTKERQVNLLNTQKLDGLSKQIETLTKKMEGTWKEEDAPPPQQLVERAVVDTKIQVSEAAAIEIYGAEEVERMVTGPDAIFRKLEKDPANNLKVMQSKLPVLEAVKLVKEYEAREKYGHDPATMRANIEKEVREELEKKYQQKAHAEQKAKSHVEIPRGLRDVSGASTQDARESEAVAKETVSLTTLFPNFAPTAG